MSNIPVDLPVSSSSSYSSKNNSILDPFVTLSTVISGLNTNSNTTNITNNAISSIGNGTDPLSNDLSSSSSSSSSSIISDPWFQTDDDPLPPYSESDISDTDHDDEEDKDNDKEEEEKDNAKDSEFIMEQYTYEPLSNKNQRRSTRAIKKKNNKKQKKMKTKNDKANNEEGDYTDKDNSKIKETLGFYDDDDDDDDMENLDGSSSSLSISSSYSNFTADQVKKNHKQLLDSKGLTLSMISSTTLAKYLHQASNASCAQNTITIKLQKLRQSVGYYSLNWIKFSQYIFRLPLPNVNQGSQSKLVLANWQKKMDNLMQDYPDYAKCKKYFPSEDKLESLLKVNTSNSNSNSNSVSSSINSLLDDDDSDLTCFEKFSSSSSSSSSSYIPGKKRRKAAVDASAKLTHSHLAELEEFINTSNSVNSSSSSNLLQNNNNNIEPGSIKEEIIIESNQNIENNKINSSSSSSSSSSSIPVVKDVFGLFMENCELKKVEITEKDAELESEYSRLERKQKAIETQEEEKKALEVEKAELNANYQRQLQELETKETLKSSKVNKLNNDKLTIESCINLIKTEKQKKLVELDTQVAAYQQIQSIIAPTQSKSIMTITSSSEKNLTTEQHKSSSSSSSSFSSSYLDPAYKPTKRRGRPAKRKSSNQQEELDGLVINESNNNEENNDPIYQLQLWMKMEAEKSGSGVEFFSRMNFSEYSNEGNRFGSNNGEGSKMVDYPLQHEWYYNDTYTGNNPIPANGGKVFPQFFVQMMLEIAYYYHLPENKALLNDMTSGVVALKKAPFTAYIFPNASSSSSHAYTVPYELNVITNQQINLNTNTVRTLERRPITNMQDRKILAYPSISFPSTWIKESKIFPSFPTQQWYNESVLMPVDDIRFKEVNDIIQKGCGSLRVVVEGVFQVQNAKWYEAYQTHKKAMELEMAEDLREIEVWKRNGYNNSLANSIENNTKTFPDDKPWWKTLIRGKIEQKNVFHGTSVTSVNSIIDRGLCLDRSLAARSNPIALYGAGIYFGVTPFVSLNPSNGYAPSSYGPLGTPARSFCFMGDILSGWSKKGTQSEPCAAALGRPGYNGSNFHSTHDFNPNTTKIAVWSSNQILLHTLLIVQVNK